MLNFSLMNGLLKFSVLIVENQIIYLAALEKGDFMQKISLSIFLLMPKTLESLGFRRKFHNELLVVLCETCIYIDVDLL